jgi:hypothetical protein
MPVFQNIAGSELGLSSGLAGTATRLSCRMIISAWTSETCSCCKARPPMSTHSGKPVRSRAGRRTSHDTQSATVGWCWRCPQRSLVRSSAHARLKATGKSTALHVAGSVWGGGDTNGYVRSWRATANALEGVCLSHSDTLLCLDVLSQLAARDAGEAAYMLANGSGKSRSSRDGSARKAAKWRVLFLSSGEIGLADKVAEDGRGKRLVAGQEIRIVDVAADAGAGMGMFENLHDFPSAEAFARHLRSAACQHYGALSTWAPS